MSEVIPRRRRRGLSMSPMELVEGECANFAQSSHPPFKGCILPPKGCEEGGCLVRDGKRCRYFETGVLRLAEMDGLANAERYRVAADAYRSMHGLAGAGGRRYCECGAPLQKRRQVCDECRARRRKETQRAAQRKWRGAM